MRLVVFQDHEYAVMLIGATVIEIILLAQPPQIPQYRVPVDVS